MQDQVVAINDLTVRFGAVTAVKEVSLSFHVGISGLLGCNGAGKTTVIRALLGLVKPDRGKLLIMGRDAAAEPLFVRANVGYMPEGMTVFPGMTGFEAVSYAGELAGLDRRVAKRRAHEMLYFAGLGEARYRPVQGFSTGMAQRVKLAMALVHDPAILFLDEPTNGLDPAGRREMLACIKNLGAERGKTVILSTHILADVEDVCQDAVLLHEGEVNAAGMIQELTAVAGKVRELVFRGELAAVIAGLAAAGFTVPEKEVRREGEFHRLQVEMSPHREEQEIFLAVKGQGGQIRGLVEVRRPLEEIFTQVTGGEG